MITHGNYAYPDDLMHFRDAAELARAIMHVTQEAMKEPGVELAPPSTVGTGRYIARVCAHYVDTSALFLPITEERKIKQIVLVMTE